MSCGVRAGVEWGEDGDWFRESHGSCVTASSSCFVFLYCALASGVSL